MKLFVKGSLMIKIHYNTYIQPLQPRLVGLFIDQMHVMKYLRQTCTYSDRTFHRKEVSDVQLDNSKPGDNNHENIHF